MGLYRTCKKCKKQDYECECEVPEYGEWIYTGPTWKEVNEGRLK